MSSSISRNFILSVAWAKALESSLPSCTSSAIAISHHAPHFLPFLEHLFWENCLTTLSCPFVSPSELSCLRDFFPSNNYVYLLSPPLVFLAHEGRIHAFRLTVVPSAQSRGFDSCKQCLMNMTLHISCVLLPAFAWHIFLKVECARSLSLSLSLCIQTLIEIANRYAKKID